MAEITGPESVNHAAALRDCIPERCGDCIPAKLAAGEAAKLCLANCVEIADIKAGFVAAMARCEGGSQKIDTNFCSTKSTLCGHPVLSKRPTEDELAELFLANNQVK